MHKFYRIGDNSSGSRGAVWMRVASVSRIIRKSCPACGIPATMPNKEIILVPEITRGTFWPDTVDVDGQPMGLYISETVKTDWDKAGFRYGKAWKGKVVGPYPKALVGSVPPRYYWIDAPVGMEIDYKASGITVLVDCAVCGEKKWTVEPGQVKTILFPETWTGLDVFGFSKSSALTFCTQRVLDLAIEKRWTNFWFSPINSRPPSQPIPYLGLSKKPTR